MRKAKGRRICIICEGDEEKDYMVSLINKRVFSDKYEFVEPINAKSINNIYYRYTDRYQSNSYDLLLIFCDTDKLPSEKYCELKQKINEFHDSDISNIAGDVIMFGNPCTMQIILSHFAEIELTSQSKSVNSKYIKELIGIENYKATEEQRKELFSKIKRSNYQTMKENISNLSTYDNVVPSTNILKFLDKFEGEDDSWIDEINNKL